MKHLLHIEKLHRTHNVEQFTCGQPELDRFLIRHALQAQQSNSSQTYIAVDGDEVAGVVGPPLGVGVGVGALPTLTTNTERPVGPDPWPMMTIEPEVGD